MLYNKNNLAVAVCAAKNSIRPELATVCFTKDYTVATDSYRLLEVSVPKVDENEFPKIDGKEVEKTIEDKILLSAKEISKIKIKKNKHLSILDNVGIMKNDSGKRMIVSTDLETTTRTSPGEVEDSYPDYHSLFSDGKDILAEITVNAQLFSELLKAMQGINHAGLVTLKIRKDHVNKPIEIHAASQTQSGRAILMPCRT